MRWISFIGTILYCLQLYSLDIPQNLSGSQRKEVLKILGLGTAAKVLSNPYPLGGHSGFELGISSEYLQIGDLSKLGSGTKADDELSYYAVHFAKGTYYHLDFVLSFTPYSQEENISIYNLQGRWGFYQAQFLPMNFSFNFYGGGANFNNLIFTQTIGADVIASISVDDITLYFGGGWLTAYGTFVGGKNGVNRLEPDQAEPITEGLSLTETHSLLGLNIDLDPAFAVFQVDRYVEPVYSFKLGFRF